MIRGIYATATGMIASQRSLDAVTHNLANASTTGYKRDVVGFGDAYEREMSADGGLGQPLGTLGSGPIEQSRYTVFEEGPLQKTDNPLDVAIHQNRGVFAVRMADGGIGYTRDGSFELNPDRELVTHDGLPVLDESLSPISIPQGSPSISSDGSISGDGAPTGTRLGLFDGALRKIGDNLFVASDPASAPEASAERSLVPQSLEGSNVNAIQSMMQMITINRSFELAQKSILQQDELTQRLIDSLRQS